MIVNIVDGCSLNERRDAGQGNSRAKERMHFQNWSVAPHKLLRACFCFKRCADLQSVTPQSRAWLYVVADRPLHFLNGLTRLRDMMARSTSLCSDHVPSVEVHVQKHPVDRWLEQSAE